MSIRDEVAYTNSWNDELRRKINKYFDSKRFRINLLGDNPKYPVEKVCLSKRKLEMISGICVNSLGHLFPENILRRYWVVKKEYWPGNQKYYTLLEPLPKLISDPLDYFRIISRYDLSLIDELGLFVMGCTDNLREQLIKGDDVSRKISDVYRRVGKLRIIDSRFNWDCLEQDMNYLDKIKIIGDDNVVLSNPEEWYRENSRKRICIFRDSILYLYPEYLKTEDDVKISESIKRMIRNAYLLKEDE